MARAGGNVVNSVWTSYRQYFLKLTMQFLNLVYFLCGLILIGIGAVMSTKYSEWVSFTKHMAGSIPMVVVCSGVIILIISIIGCFGSAKESPCLIAMYSFMLAIVFLMQLIAGIMAYAKREIIHQTAHKSADTAIKTYTVGDMMTQHPIDQLQSILHCCGINKGPIDWENSTKWLDHASQLDGFKRDADLVHVPESCCINDFTRDENCGLNINKNSMEKHIWTEGCFHVLSAQVLEKITTIAVAAIVICLIELAGVIVAGCLWRHIHNTKYATF